MGLVNSYLPMNKVNECKTQLFDCLLDMLTKGPEPSVKNPIVQNIFNFICSKEQIQLAQSWIDSGFIHTSTDTNTSLNELTPADKRKILKTLCQSTQIATETKQAVIEKVLGDDKSDVAKKTRLGCEACFATKENKDKLWETFIDEKTELSIQDREAMISGFCSWDQLELCEPYFDKYYDALDTLSEKHAYRYQRSFCMGLMPRKWIKDEHLVRLM